MKRARFRFRVISCLARTFLTLSLAGWLPVQAVHASGVVTNCTETDLRAAMAGGGLVRLECDGTILTGQITATGKTVLDGTGHHVILSGNHAVPVFYVANGAELSLTNLTIANGRSFGPGGGIGNLGKLNAHGCTFSGNQASGYGGAIYNVGVLRLSSCAFLTNTSESFGGAIASGYVVRPGASFLITNCTFAGNIASNQATIDAALSPGFVVNSTIAGNVGIGLSAAISPVTLINSILASNTAGNCSAVTDGGHNISSDGSGNFNPLFSFTSNNNVTLLGCIVAHSLWGNNADGTILDGGHNISSDISCRFTAPGSLNNTDPKLGPLADYSGPTPTMALLTGSPALDAASSASCPLTDQRGRPRPFGADCDIGAFESSPPYSVRGVITGYLPPTNPITVKFGANIGTVDGAGRYFIRGFAAGTHLLTPSSPGLVFGPSNRVVNLGPDLIGVDFHSYWPNALVLESVSGPAVHGVFAGEIGQTYRVLVSPDLSHWTPWSTNTVEASGLFEFFDGTLPSQPKRFFQVVRP